MVCLLNMFLLPSMLLLLLHQIQASPVADNSKGQLMSKSSSSEPIRALKMLGPDPLAPGQRGTVKTDYFDPKTYSTKDLRDFHRLTQGLNADIRRMVDETERIRQKSVEDAEELSRLREWAGRDQSQWLLLLTGSAMAVALLALALANLLLVKVALKLKASGGKAKQLLLDEAA